jgi:hypothetical protein
MTVLAWYGGERTIRRTVTKVQPQQVDKAREIIETCLPARQRICADLVGRPPNLGQRPPLRHSSARYLLSHERLEARTDVRYSEAATIAGRATA